MTTPLDPLALTQALIRRPSITPEDAGALDVLAAPLEEMGFTCHRMVFSEPGTPDVDNLYARLGGSGPNLCYAGHTDVVPVGDAAHWSVDPFAATVVDGVLIGRGVVDMKGAIACYVAAAQRFLAEHGPDFGGSLSFLITGDEEGPAINGTRKVLDWMTGAGERIDACIVGEPTNPDALGQMVKIGRRGSLNGELLVRGVQGHAAYPHNADNPVHRILVMLDAVIQTALDDGTDHFQPSTLTVTSIDVGNPSTNVIPETARARFNVRFNDAHTSTDIIAWLRHKFDAFGADYDLAVRVSGEAFLTPPGRLSDVLVAAAEAVTGMTPELSTSGGTSDARFIKDHCPVAEFGLMNETAHKVDEAVAVEDLYRLTDIYHRAIEGFFAGHD